MRSLGFGWSTGWHRGECRRNRAHRPACDAGERALCRLVDESIYAVLTWDRAELGDVVFNGQRFGIRMLNGAIITKAHPDSPRKIDVAVAAVVAYERAMWHASSGMSGGELMVAII